MEPERGAAFAREGRVLVAAPDIIRAVVGYKTKCGDYRRMERSNRRKRKGEGPGVGGAGGRGGNEELEQRLSMSKPSRTRRRHGCPRDAARGKADGKHPHRAPPITRRPDASLVAVHHNVQVLRSRCARRADALDWLLIDIQPSPSSPPMAISSRCVLLIGVQYASDDGSGRVCTRSSEEGDVRRGRARQGCRRPRCREEVRLATPGSPHRPQGRHVGRSRMLGLCWCVACGTPLRAMLIYRRSHRRRSHLD